MLKPVDPAMAPANGDDRPVGELVHQLVEQGKSYAQAELGLAKAIAASKAETFKVPAILLATAFLLVQAAVTVLAVAAFVALEQSLGPLFAGLAAFLIFAGIAGGLAYLAVQKLGGDK
jgi:hypothetical protein